MEEEQYMKEIIVTTGDLKQDYEVICPIYFQVSNKGILGSSLSRLTAEYRQKIQAMRQNGTMSAPRADWGFLYGEFSVGQNEFETAFFVATEEIKKRAKLVHADAVIGMRQDIDMDTNGFQFFYLQMYGTAVRFRNEVKKTLAQQYAEAMEMLKNGDYEQAEEKFTLLGEFRDSKEQAKAAWKANIAAEEERLLREKAKEERLAHIKEESESSMADLPIIIESCKKFESAREIYEYLEQLGGTHPYLEEARDIARQYKDLERLYGKMPKSVIHKYEEMLATKWK